MAKIGKWLLLGLVFKALVSFSFYLENEAEVSWRHGTMKMGQLTRMLTRTQRKN